MTKSNSERLEKPRQVKVGSVRTLGEVASEMGTVYRAMRRSELRMDEGKALVYVLDKIRQVLGMELQPPAYMPAAPGPAKLGKKDAAVAAAQTAHLEDDDWSGLVQ